MKTVVVTCQKGGVGKTTTALNLGAGLANKRKKVLFVDLDAQGNLTDTLGGSMEGAASSELIKGVVPAKDIIQKTQVADLIPAGDNLVGLDEELKEEKDRALFLSRGLSDIQGNYDYCIIDTPPALGLLTMSALAAANEAIITVQADPYSLRALGQLSRTLDVVLTHMNKGLKITGILLTRHSPRAILSRDMAEMIGETAKAFGTSLFKTSIREAIAIKESQAVQQTIFQYAPKSSVAEDYRSLVAEFLKRTK